MVGFFPEDAHEVGAVAGEARSSDVVDVHVVAVAHRRGLGVLTSDADDVTRIVAALAPPVLVVPV